jgi:arylsulfatase A-like enzyme
MKISNIRIEGKQKVMKDIIIPGSFSLSGHFAFFALSVLSISCGPEKQKIKKPNLLFIWTDEQQAKTMAAYGNTKIRTPNLNRLAEESVVFLNPYVTQPVCTPSRASILTGLYPHTSGCLSNNTPLNDTISALPGLLNDVAYKTAYMGKWHLGEEIFPHQGFQTWVSLEDAYSGYFKNAADKNARSSYHQWLLKKGYKPDTEDNKFSRGFAAKLPIEDCKPGFLAEQACRYLEQNKDHPFILYVNFLEPHMPFTGPLDNMYNPEEVDLPKNYSDTLDESEPLRYRLKREGTMKKYGEKEADMRRLIAKYWGLVSQVDQSVGTILDKLKNLGLDENTIVVFTSDHGDMMGAHNMVEKQVMFEEAVRVPLLLKVPFLKDLQKTVTQRVSQIDIVPTLLDLMGGKIAGHLQGKSLLPVIRGEKTAGENVFIEWNPDPEFNVNQFKDSKLAQGNEILSAEGTATRTVISPDGWKLCLSNKDKNQLYDLNNDSLETTNLINDQKCREKIRELSQKIREWQVQTGDTVLVAAGI